MKILIINGPNINMLGLRNNKVYGDVSYKEFKENLLDYCLEKEVEVKFFQSNCEGDLINRIHTAHYDELDGIIINPGAYGHYSIALRDALEILNIPIIEVHISNIYAREDFRRNSVIAPVCLGQISGLGLYGYVLAIEKIIDMKLNEEE